VQTPGDIEVVAIAKVTFTGPDRVRDVLHNFSPSLSTGTVDEAVQVGDPHSRWPPHW
jgi:hypothetical protein